MSRLQTLQRLLATDPADPFTLYALAQEHAKLATPAGHTEALHFYDLCLAADPAYCYAYFHKAQSLRALEREPDAIATLNAGITAAKIAKDAKALSELSSLLDELT